MQTLARLFDLIGGRPLPEEEDGPATRAQIVLRALLASVLFAAVYGLAAGSTDLALALGNLYKLPMVIVLSALAAVPAALLTWKLAGGAQRSSDLVMGLAAGNLTGTLVLAVLAPVVALYYHTSGWLGGTLALAASGIALSVGFFTLIRAVVRRAPDGVPLPTLAAPLVVMIAMQLAVLVQLIYVASPILPEVTVFDAGMDGIVAR